MTNASVVEDRLVCVTPDCGRSRRYGPICGRCYQKHKIATDAGYAKMHREATQRYRERTRGPREVEESVVFEEGVQLPTGPPKGDDFYPRPEKGWRKWAACAGRDLTWWSNAPGRGHTETTRKAAAICYTCAVRQECMQWSLHFDEVGICGGKNKMWRNRVSKQGHRDKTPTVNICLTCDEPFLAKDAQRRPECGCHQHSGEVTPLNLTQRKAPGKA